MTADQFSKTMVVWRRTGKEHGENDGFRVNSPETIAMHLDGKLTEYRATPEDAWRWYQVDEGLIVEKFGLPAHGPFRADTRFYHLIERGISVMENLYFRPPNDRWRWYLHLADIYFDSSRACWIMKDLFCDILVDHDKSHHRVLDLDELGDALEMGLVTPADMIRVLRNTDAALEDIAAGKFPFPEIVRAHEACRALGWDSVEP